MDITMPEGETTILVIDTNAYSGNFEREMGGYVAGAYDDREHGGKEAELFAEEVPCAQDIKRKLRYVKHAEYGDVLVTIRATPGRLNNGAGYNYDEGADARDAKDRAKKAMAEFEAPTIARCEERLANEDFEPDRPGAWTIEACERTIADALASIEQAGGFVGYPAYESLAIFMSEPLTDTELEIVKQRAHKYASSPKTFTGSVLGSKPFKIIDVYQVKHKLVQSTQESRL